MSLNSKDKADLKAARDALENPSFLIELTNWVGKPLEKGLAKLPAPVTRKIPMRR